MNLKQPTHLIHSALKFVMAFLLMASASLVGAQTLQTLCVFNLNIIGHNPYAGLTLGRNGNLYGTTYWGGTWDAGTVFQVATNGTVTTIAIFGGTNSGQGLTAGLALDNEGNFYGTTLWGGTNNNSNYSAGMGTVFRMATSGTLTTLVSFNSTNGVAPYAGLTLGNDGNFYGTTRSGGTNDYGTVFLITTNGTLTTLVSFNGGNGATPYAGLALGTDGNFYGATSAGGVTNSTYPSGMGTLFRMTTNGTLITLYSFSGNDGASPLAELTLGNDGNFYGTTSRNTGGGGTVFRITPSGTLSTLVSFPRVNGAYPNGASPQAALTLGSDGNFYGTTEIGGTIQNGNYPNGMGTVFRVTTNGTLTTLVSFSSTNGVFPLAALTLGNDGNFYGTASQAGSSYGDGTVFRLLLPPIIAVQPLSQTNNAGTTVTFFVSATSITPMSYQWQKNGTNLFDGSNLLGANTNALTITGISDNDAANYSVIVSNTYFSLTNYAALTVIDAPIITAQPTNQMLLQGANATFGISITGSVPFCRYQWRFNGTNLLNATNAVYSISAATTNKPGNYSVVVTNAAGVAISSNAALTVVLSPANRTNYAGSTATLTAIAFTPEALNYQWQISGTNLFDAGNISGSTNNSLTVANVSDADAAIYNLVVSDATGSVTTSNAVLTVNDSPFIATQPQSQTVVTGSVVTLSATGYGAPPLIFQWYFGNNPVGSPTSGTNVSSYTMTNVGTNQAGNYTVKVVNSYGNVTSSNATLIVALPPVITTQPTNRMVAATSNATFSVTVSSLSALSYQWQQNGTNLINGGKFSGATNSTLTITSVSSNEAAIYSVAITNLAGNVTSSNATLTVIYPPVITAQPLGQRLVLGNGVAFNVAVSGTAPFHYQWRFNAGNLLNATNVIYAIQTIGTNNTGNYSVVVTNFAGSVTSSNALLVVLVPPSLALQLWAGYPLLNLNGMLSNNFVVQYNSDLTGTNWITLQTFSNLLVSPYRFLDPAGVVPPARFYRVLMQ